MKSVLVLYMSRGGHTARIARRICESVVAAGGRGEMMDINEADHEGVDWERYDVLAFGAPVLYGKRPQPEEVVVLQHVRGDGAIGDADVGLTCAEHDPHQLTHPAQRACAAPDRHFLNSLPSAEGRRQPT